jgi:cytochrome oxidase Cu insertion factor (SCO1/SenC/PrrC family)
MVSLIFTNPRVNRHYPGRLSIASAVCLSLPIAYERGSPSRRSALICLLLALSLVAWYVTGVLSRASIPAAPSASIGNTLNQPVPKTIASLPLENEEGNPVTLSQFKGRELFLAPFLTSCQEECPITTASILQMQRALLADHLTQKVAIVEVTVDPETDTPARMAAYARLTGSTWPLLTGSPKVLASLWRYFGVYYKKVPEGSPPGIDWETHRPYTYDVDHSDGFVLLDHALHERFVTGGMTRITQIPATLHKLLDAQGDHNLANPGAGTWTVSDALNAMGWILGRQIPST